MSGRGGESWSVKELDAIEPIAKDPIELPPLGSQSWREFGGPFNGRNGRVSKGKMVKIIRNLF